MSFAHAFRHSIAASVAIAALVPNLAFAQTADPASDGANASASEDEIVVTGTLIRGAAPVGSNLISVGQGTLVETGATTSNELLATIPQVSNYFNRIPAADLGVQASQFQISRPNLRGISPNNAASSATLILFDGHRIATAGTKQASVDPDVIPAGAIERVEVVTEGGSATYGADAVAGVINFITRKRFDGIKVDARYGIASDYWQVDANATIGKDWGTGSAYVSYTFTKNRALFGRDRDFIRGLNYAAQPYLPSGRQCDAANIRLTGPAANFGVPNLASQSVNSCDLTDETSIIPEVERHGVVASLYQELSPSTTILAKTFYSQRDTTILNTFRGTVNVGTNNPFYRQIPSRPNETQTIDFSFGPALGRSTAPATVSIKEWGANAEITQRLGSNWQLRGLFNYSASNTLYVTQGVNTTRLSAAGNAAGLTTTSAINPYDIAATNTALLMDLIDNYQSGQAKDELLDLRAIVDGRLLTLPGGDVRVAVGYEYMHDTLRNREQDNLRQGRFAAVPYNRYGRSVHSVFGELLIPVFGPDNALGGIQSLQISAQGRFDHYSDFGNTFNPKLGITYKPIDGLSLRGNWGTSFTAPTPLDQLGVSNNRLSFVPYAPFVRPGDEAALAAAGGALVCCETLAYQGSRPGLQPQTATTWSVGFDVTPSTSGFRASVSYYNVKFENILGTPTPGNGIFLNFPNAVTTALPGAGGLTLAQISALRGTALNSDAAVDQALADPRPTYSIVDFRVGNYGIVKVTGIDFSTSYRRQVGFGSIDLAINGNYQLSRKSQPSPGAPVTDNLTGDAARGVDGSPRLALQTTLGATIGSLRAQATWNHTSGFAIPQTTSAPAQSRVDAFDTVNLFFKYDFDGDDDWRKGLSLTLNVNNLFDQAPPVLLRNGQNENGYANGFTIGRMFVVGLSKQF